MSLLSIPAVTVLAALWCVSAASASVTVGTALELRNALLDEAVSYVVIKSTLSVSPRQFQPVAVSRRVVVTAAGPHATLSFSNSTAALIRVAAGGNLTLANLTILDFHSQQALPYTAATALAPIPAVQLSSSDAVLVLDSCTMVFQGQLSSLYSTMPFWSAQLQQDGVDWYPAKLNLSAGCAGQPSPAGSKTRWSASSAALQEGAAAAAAAIAGAAAAQQRLVGLVNGDYQYYGGSSRLAVSSTVLAVDPTGCYGSSSGSYAMAVDSRSLLNALQDSGSGATLVFVDIVLDPLDFIPWGGSVVGNKTLTACSGNLTTIDLSQLHHAVRLSQGAVLTVTGGLSLLQAPTAKVFPAISSDSSSSSNDHSSEGSSSSERPAMAPELLLLGSVDVSQGGRLVLGNVSVGVSSSTSSVKKALQDRYPASMSLATSASSAQMQQGMLGPTFSIQSLDVALGGVRFAGSRNTVAAAGAGLVLDNVIVFQAPAACFPASACAAVAADDAELHALLHGRSVNSIQVIGNMKMSAAHWQGSAARNTPFDILQPVELRGCHPDGAQGARYTIDLSELQAVPTLLVHAMLRFSGDLAVIGLQDWPDAPGSWFLVPMVKLTGNGSLLFEDVMLEGRAGSLLHDRGSALWQPDSLAPAQGAWLAESSSMVELYHYALPAAAMKQLYPTTATNSSAAAIGSNSSSQGGYYGYSFVQLSWQPNSGFSSPQQDGSASTVAAIVLGSLLGALLLLLAAGFALLHWRNKRYARMGYTVKPSWGCCGPNPGLPVIGGGKRSDGTGSDAASAAALKNVALYSPAGPVGTTVGRSASIENSQVRLTMLGPDGVGPQWVTEPKNQGGESHHSLYGQHQADYEAGYMQYDRRQLANLEACASSHRGRPYTAGPLVSNAHQFNSPPGPATEGNTTGTDEGTGGDMEGGGVDRRGQHKQQVFEDARKRLGATAGDLAHRDALVLEAVLGEGTFGKVFRGYWKGTLVAVKTMMFPAAMSGKEKREKMAIMETAISASLSHPNVVQMYTYYLRPVLVGHEAQINNPSRSNEAQRLDSSSVGDSTMNIAFLNEGLTDSVHSWEVQLVLEYCDQGSLRQLLNHKSSFTLPDGSRDMVLILDTALDVARAMLHLHSENIIHSDLKARNILLKSSGGADGRQFVAKVADFGLSMRIDPTATHVSNVYQGTMTHMAPEVMLQGKLSRGSDVYAFGVLLWELYSGSHAFKGIPRALLGHEVAHRQRRPQFPDHTPFDYQLLACRCWESDASIRPSFQEILLELQRMRERMAAQHAAAAASSSVFKAPSLPAAAGAARTKQGPAGGVISVSARSGDSAEGAGITPFKAAASADTAGDGGSAPAAAATTGKIADAANQSTPSGAGKVVPALLQGLKSAARSFIQAAEGGREQHRSQEQQMHRTGTADTADMQLSQAANALTAAAGAAEDKAAPSHQPTQQLDRRGSSWETLPGEASWQQELQWPEGASSGAREKSSLHLGSPSNQAGSMTLDGGKSTYLKDSLDSTLNDTGPFWAVYGAQQKNGGQYTESDSDGNGGRDNVKEQQPSPGAPDGSILQPCAQGAGPVQADQIAAASCPWQQQQLQLGQQQQVGQHMQQQQVAGPIGGTWQEEQQQHEAAQQQTGLKPAFKRFAAAAKKLLKPKQQLAQLQHQQGSAGPPVSSLHGLVQGPPAKAAAAAVAAAGIGAWQKDPSRHQQHYEQQLSQQQQYERQLSQHSAPEQYQQAALVPQPIVQQQQQLHGQGQPQELQPLQQYPQQGQHHLTVSRHRLAVPASPLSSTGGLSPLGDSTVSHTSQPSSQSGRSAAAVAAVMSLKSALAKRAMAPAAAGPAAANAAADTVAGHVSGSVRTGLSPQQHHAAVHSIATAVPPQEPLSHTFEFGDPKMQSQHAVFANQPGLGPPGFGGAADGAGPSWWHGSHSPIAAGPTAAADSPSSSSAAAAAANAAGRYSLDVRKLIGIHSLPPAAGFGGVAQQQTAAGTAAAGMTAHDPNAAADDRGRYSLDTRQAAGKRLPLRPSLSARGGFAGLTSQFTRATGFASGGSIATVTAAASQLPATAPDVIIAAGGGGAPTTPHAARLPPSSSARQCNATSARRSVRKAVSASQLVITPTAAAAAAATGGGGGVSDPLVSERFLAPLVNAEVTRTNSSDARQLQQMHQQQQQSQQLPGLPWLQGGSGSTGHDPTLTALHPDQLELLAQIADAARAQVALPIGLTRPGT